MWGWWIFIVVIVLFSLLFIFFNLVFYIKWLVYIDGVVYFIILFFDLLLLNFFIIIIEFFFIKFEVVDNFFGLVLGVGIVDLDFFKGDVFVFEFMLSRFLVLVCMDREVLYVVGDGCGKVDKRGWWFVILGCFNSF